MIKPLRMENGGTPRWLSFLQSLGLLPLVALTVLLSPFVPVNLESVHWHGVQTVSVECGTVLLLMALLSCPWSLSALQAFGLRQRQPAFLCLHLLLLWALISCLRAPTPFAIQGFLILAGGVLVANVVAAQAVTGRRLLFMAFTLLLTASLVTVSGLAQLGNNNFALAVGILHDHQLFGAFLMQMIPLALSLSVMPGTSSQRLPGQAALLICMAGLLESQHRSAWIGTMVACCVFGGLVFGGHTLTPARKLSPGDQRRRLLLTVLPAAVFLIALLGTVADSPDRDRLLARLRTVQSAAQNRDDSMQWRQEVWRGTREMIAAKPVIGGGIGSFPLSHFPYTDTGHSQAIVQAEGPSIEDEAHNSYLQIWAEMGIIGLVLWVGTFISLLAAGVNAVRYRAKNSLEQWLLIGGLSAIAGQMTDALANPAWQFGHIALPLWIIFGMTAALSYPAATTLVEVTPKHYPSPWRIAQAIAAVGFGLWLLQLILRTAFALPAPHL